MDKNNQTIESQISGYIDGELTQQDSQRIRLLLEENPEYAQLERELRALRTRLGQAQLSPSTEKEWRETMDENIVTSTYHVGWLMLLGGALIIGGYLLFDFITTGPWGIAKVGITLLYGGLAVLFISVLRQRLIEHKTDKYNDVEI